jgi:hypothetical protein
VDSKRATSAGPVRSHGDAGRIWRWRHLARRFFEVLSARVQPESLDVLNDYLSLSEKALFLTMSIPDQRHSLDLFSRIHAAGHAEADLLRAALLHDVGKGAGSLPLPCRVVYALAVMALPALAGWLSRSAHSIWRRPFYLAANHPRLGAEAAGRAGSNATVVRLIAEHGAPGHDELSRILYEYDRGM